MEHDPSLTLSRAHVTTVWLAKWSRREQSALGHSRIPDLLEITTVILVAVRFLIPI